MPEAVLLRQHGSWERTRRAPRPQPDGGDAHRAMLPDRARYPPHGRAARVRCTTKSIAKKSTTGSLPPAVPLVITPTFSQWTHTSDDSYIYQLSLVLATAIVSFFPETPYYRNERLWRESRRKASTALYCLGRHRWKQRRCMIRIKMRATSCGLWVRNGEGGKRSSRIPRQPHTPVE